MNELTNTEEAIQINKDIKINENKNKNDRIEECILKTIQTSSPFEKIDRHLSNVSKSICKIKIGNIIGTGFLLNFRIEQEMFYFLISNEHVIKNNIIQKINIIINISYNNEFKYTKIKLGNKKRYIKSFIDIDLDITVIEILDEDNISKEYFLRPQLESLINIRLINSMIYIPQYAGGNKLVNARGIIKEINQYEFTHLVNTEKGSSGSPIFLENSIFVIGIHKHGNKEKTENYGDFIYPAINIIKNDIKIKRNNGKYINGKYIWEDDKYYIGEFKNNLPNDKGIKYYSNGNILYQGDFMVYQMVKEQNIIQMEILNMKAFLLIIKEKEMEKLLKKMVNIILDNLKKIYQMLKEQHIIQMEIFYIKVILLMVNLKEMENIFMKMVNIIQVNLKIVYKMEKEYYSIQMEILVMKVIG